MSNFLVLVEKIFPLYVIIGFGFLAGRFLKVERDSVARVALYFVVPVVVFNSFATMPKGNSYLLLPVLFFSIAVAMSMSFLLIAKILPSKPERNLLAAAVGSGNTGYFGAPLVLAVFGQQYLNIAVIASLGLVFYENTVAYYLLSRSHHNIKDSFKKMASLPAIYACIFGIFFNKFNWTLSENISNNINYFKGAYVVLGMMIIGIALSSVTRASIDLKFGLLAFGAKFFIYPVVVGSFIYLDNNHFEIFDNKVHDIILVLSAVPMAANFVSYASNLKVNPEKIATTIFASTVFALLYLPVFISVFVE